MQQRTARINVSLAEQCTQGDIDVIDRFVQAVWMENGLSENTLAAYQRDLRGLAAWLSQQGGSLPGTSVGFSGQQVPEWQGLAQQCTSAIQYAAFLSLSGQGRSARG